MIVGRFTAYAFALTATLVLAGGLPAAETPSKVPPAHAATRTKANPKKDSAAARAERERRADLERRVEKLEQRYEMQEPVMPPPDAAPARPAP